MVESGCCRAGSLSLSGLDHSIILLIHARKAGPASSSMPLLFSVEPLSFPRAAVWTVLKYGVLIDLCCYTLLLHSLEHLCTLVSAV